MSLFRGIAYIVLGDQAFTGYPDGFAYFGQGYVWWVFSFELVLFALLAVAFGVLLARDQLRPRRLRHRQQPDRRALLRHPRRPREVHPVPPHRPDVRRRRGLPHLPPRLDPPVDRPRLGARDRHHGGPRRRLDPRRLRHRSPASSSPRSSRHGHLRLRPAQRPRHRHVDLHRPAADRRHRPADLLAQRLRDGGPDAEVRLPHAPQPRPGGRVQAPPRRDLARARRAAAGRPASPTTRSTSTARPATLFGVLWRRDDHTMDDLPEPPGHAPLVGHMADIMETKPDNSPVAVPLETVFHLE